MRSLEERTGAVVLKNMESAGVPLNEWSSACWRGRGWISVKSVSRERLDDLIADLTQRGEPLLCSPALHGLGWISVWDGEGFCITFTGFSPTGEAPPPLMVPAEMETFER